MPKVGSKVLVESFEYINRGGGTGSSNWELGSNFLPKVVEVKIIKSWEDYETGRQFIGEPVTKELITFLDENGHKTDRRIFFSQWELAKKLVHGLQYWLGATWGTYNVYADSFQGGNWAVARGNTIYKDWKVSKRYRP